MFIRAFNGHYGEWALGRSPKTPITEEKFTVSTRQPRQHRHLLLNKIGKRNILWIHFSPSETKILYISLLQVEIKSLTKTGVIHVDHRSNQI